MLMSENFNHGTFPPPDWTVENVSGDDTNWQRGGNVSNYWAIIDGHLTWDVVDDRLVSESVDCTGYASGLKLKWQSIYQTTPAGTDTAYVDVSTDNGSSWTTLKFYTEFLSSVNDSADVPQAANQAQVKFRWRYVAPDWERYSWRVDNILFEGAIPHDVGVDSLLGPSTDDKLRAGAQIKVWVKVKNYAGNSETNVQVICVSSPASYSSTLTIGSLAAGGDTLLSFPSLWTVPSSGSYSLKAYTTLAGDGDASNDSTEATGLTPFSFSVSQDLLLSWENTTERDPYVQALTDLAVGYDSWDRGSNGNLYGLEAWETVIFAERSGFYPAVGEQVALMRYLDEASVTRGKKYLVFSGDHVGNYYNIGVVSREFFEDYLHATYSGQLSTAGTADFYAAACTYIGGSDATDTLAVDQNHADKIGGDASAETLYVFEWTPTVTPVAMQYEDTVREHVYLGFDFSDITSASQRSSLLERILAWFEGPPPPAAMTELAIEAVGTMVQISWDPDPTWICPLFRVYRGNDPYFAPTVVYQEVDASPFQDPGAAGNEATNYFYQIAPVDFGIEGDFSSTVGEMDFSLP